MIKEIIQKQLTRQQKPAMYNSRRKFIQNTMLLGAGISMPQILSASDFGLFTRTIKASDQINFGLIGCKGMGWSNMNAHLKLPQVNCIALADVDQNVLDQRTEDVFKLRGKRPKQYRDYRKLLEDPAIDVVIIGTPDHWHCLNMVDGVSAGKHVYVEKPIANTIE
ncbi:MAG: Gfo/Idh/MocA family oxidoreductase, partial [Daejeonella sp.]|nr:Gfo/Idh/MocA family oxidoreductase [Daejeonella sp.]